MSRKSSCLRQQPRTLCISSQKAGQSGYQPNTARMAGIKRKHWVTVRKTKEYRLQRSVNTGLRSLRQFVIPFWAIWWLTFYAFQTIWFVSLSWENRHVPNSSIQPNPGGHWCSSYDAQNRKNHYHAPIAALSLHGMLPSEGSQHQCEWTGPQQQATVRHHKSAQHSKKVCNQSGHQLVSRNGFVLRCGLLADCKYCVANRIAKKCVCAQDGVHFTTEGYDNLVTSINKSVSLLANSILVVNTSKKQHNWRGFKSLRDSASVASNVRGCARGGKAVRGWRHFRPYHPYRRGKWVYLLLITKTSALAFISCISSSMYIVHRNNMSINVVATLAQFFIICC
jgi:hypothetical protein